MRGLVATIGDMMPSVPQQAYTLAQMHDKPPFDASWAPSQLLLQQASEAISAWNARGIWLSGQADFPAHFPTDKLHHQGLFMQGAWPVSNRPWIGIVGSRKADTFAQQQSFYLAASLNRLHNAVIVSGMANGIDKAAHRGAMAVNGVNAMVLGQGFDTFYYKELYNENLHKGGFGVSQFLPHQEASKTTFPARNLVIAGLSHVVCLTSALSNSGTRHVVNAMAEYGRPVVTTERLKERISWLRESDHVVPISSFSQPWVPQFIVSLCDIAQ